MSIPPSHPRYASLLSREKIAEGVHHGIVHETGLIAHGRGEAFDYLLGEKTIAIAANAARAAAYRLYTADRPVISVNGNTAVLAGENIINLAKIIDADIEVNLFHRSVKRVNAIVSFLSKRGAEHVLGEECNARIPGLDHDRAKCSRDGIFAADVILVPLEDGDRCEALRAMGKTVITIDLNPLSRTARTANITIVDNVVRAFPAIITFAKEEDFIISWDNLQGLKSTIEYINCRLGDLYQTKK